MAGDGHKILWTFCLLELSKLLTNFMKASALLALKQGIDIDNEDVSYAKMVLKYFVNIFQYIEHRSHSGLWLKYLTPSCL